MFSRLVVKVLRPLLDNSSFLKQAIDAIPVGERTTSSDFSIVSNAKSAHEIQRIAFLDSRGKKIFPDSDPDFLAALIAKEWDNKSEKYLIVTRSHANTTIFTLLNFLENLQLKIPYLLTNVGFVDFTPKKKSVADDILLQARELFPETNFKLVDLGVHKLSSGANENLVALDLFVVAESLSNHLSRLCGEVIFIATNEIPENTLFDRERPTSFYSQLRETNKFLNLLVEKSKIKMVVVSPPSVLGEIKNYIYDGVHLTGIGHISLFQKLLAEKSI